MRYTLGLTSSGRGADGTLASNAASVVRDRGAHSLQDLIDVAARNEQAWESRNNRREPVRLERLEFDLVRVHGLTPCFREIGPAAASRPTTTLENRPLVRVWAAQLWPRPARIIRGTAL